MAYQYLVYKFSVFIYAGKLCLNGAQAMGSMGAFTTNLKTSRFVEHPRAVETFDELC